LCLNPRHKAKARSQSMYSDICGISWAFMTPLSDRSTAHLSQPIPITTTASLSTTKCMQKSCTDSRKLGATPRSVRQSQRLEYNSSHFCSSLGNSRRSRSLASNTREVEPRRSRLKYPLIPFPSLRSIERVLEAVTIGRWLNLQCTVSNSLNDEPLTFDLF